MGQELKGMFTRVLVANRGEIACRVIRTARRLGIATVAVYSDADADALHVAMADEAVRIGPAPARESYLCIERVLEAAERTRCDAIHPGYGFLAENADFARAVGKRHITFIGPPPEAIRAMGSKSEARRRAEAAGVPVLPGFHEDERDPAKIREAAGSIGYPLLLKPSAGGGGKGMKVVEEEKDLPAALESARREAASSFGDDRLILEKYLRDPRHIEVQVFADDHGALLHLFERDCSIQRRYQKIIEEAPAPGLDAAQRRDLGEAALRIVAGVGYRGAGTVEFLFDADRNFYFMEMNTRLQVEHRVTEMVTGQDLVEWQFLVASGAPLPCRQEEITLRGHAIEARIYAEDPRRGFQPASGPLLHLRPPEESTHLRVDLGVRAGEEIRIEYDPLLAKLIVWDRTREAARRRLEKALDEFHLTGVANNLDFLAAVAGSPAYRQERVDTGFIRREEKELFPDRSSAPPRILALAALAVLLRRAEKAADAAARSSDPHSPWHLTDGWRAGGEHARMIELHRAGKDIPIRVQGGPETFRIELGKASVTARGRFVSTGEMVAEIDGHRVASAAVESGRTLIIQSGGQTCRFTRPGGDVGESGAEQSPGTLTAPMPGKVIAIRVAKGEAVAGGKTLIVLEAMKMEQTISAPAAGKIADILCRVGDTVGEGSELLRMDVPEGEAP